MLPYAYKFKNKFQLEVEGIAIIFLCDFRSHCSSNCTMFPSLITNLLLQFVRDVVNRVCYHRYKKLLEQQKGCLNINVYAAEENLEEEL